MLRCHGRLVNILSCTTRCSSTKANDTGVPKRAKKENVRSANAADSSITNPSRRSRAGTLVRNVITETIVEGDTKHPNNQRLATRSKPPRDSREHSESSVSPLIDFDHPRAAEERHPKSAELPARLVPATSAQHYDLGSFLEYAARTKLNSRSNVYKGTHYEYTVAKTLRMLNFTLHRTGRSNDLGIDLIGHWKLPHHNGLPVLVQCKAAKPTPSMIRELEGAYTGAPAGWKGAGVLALLVATRESTEGIRAALQRSRCPMGALQVTSQGEIKQFLWNTVAIGIGLEGLGVTMRYETEGKGDAVSGDQRTERHVTGSIALTWMGRLWKGEAW